MADDLSLLFRLRAENSQAKATLADTRAAVSQLRTTFGSEMSQIQGAATTALGGITSNLTRLSGSLPIVGNSVNSLALSFGTMAGEGTAAAGSLAAIGGPAGLAVISLGALAAAVVAVHKGFFNLATQAAEFRGKLFDLSQQTGVSVETLNALEISAGKTGGSIESISQSLVIFQGHLDDAQDSSSKIGKKFDELGISTENTETAFRDAVRALAAMDEGFHQTNEAAELFGRRGGKQVLAIIKETNGDIDSAVTKLGALARVTREDAKAADDFNDALHDLNTLTRGAFGKEAIPAATDALKGLAKTLKDNDGAIKAVGLAVSVLSTTLGGEFKRSLQVVNELWRQAEAPVRVVADLYERIALAAGIITRTNFSLATGTAGQSGLEVGGTPSVKLPGLKTNLLGTGLAESDARAKAELEFERHLREDLRLEHEKRGGDLADFYEKLQLLTDTHLATLQEQIARERLLNQQAFERGAIDVDELNKRKADLDQRATEAKNKRDEETRRLTLEKNRAEVQEEIRHRTQLAQIADAARQGELKRLTDAAERGRITEAVLISRQLDLLKEVHQERLGVINFELNAETTSAERKEELNTRKKIAEREYTDEYKRLIRERMDALQVEQREAAPGSSFNPIDVEDIKVFVPDLPEPPPALSNWIVLMQTINEELVKFSTFTTENLVGAFHQMVGAVAQGVAAWALYGESLGKAVRKALAASLAAIAADAIIQALYHAAYAVGKFAFGDFAGGTRHLIAAAKFAAVAVAAGVGARVIAGNSFGGSGSGDSSNSGQRSSSSGSRSSSGEVKAIDVDRRSVSSVQQPIVQTIEFRVKGGVIVDEFAQDYLLNGRTRILIKSDGQG